MKFSKFLASAAAISMLATAVAANVSAEDQASLTVGGDPSSKPYDFSYAVEGDSAVIIGLTQAAAGINEVTIPDQVSIDGKDVKLVGASNFAFADLDLKVVNVPDTFDAEKVSTVAFLTKADIKEFLTTALAVTEEDLEAAAKELAEIDPESVYGEDGAINVTLSAVTNKVISFAANTVHFKGKTDWTGTEAELVDGAIVLGNVYEQVKKKLGVEKLDIADFIIALYNYPAGDLSEVVRAEDEETVEKMSAQSYANFVKWVETISYGDLTIKGSENSSLKAYAEGKAILGVKFEVASTALLGDVNHDGKVDIRDAAYIAKACADLNHSIVLENETADYNQDGKSDIRDAAAIAKHLAEEAIK